MKSYLILILIALVSINACKQAENKSTEVDAGFGDLEKELGHLFNEVDSTKKDSLNLPLSFTSDNFEFNFQTIDRNLFDTYLSKKKETSFNPELPQNIVHKDSCFYITYGNMKDTLCDNLSNDFSDDYIDYQFIGYWDSLNYAVFESGIYEELVYFIYDINSKEKVFLWNVPSQSPFGKFIFTYSMDLVAGFQPNGIQLFYVDQNKLIKQFELEFDNWGPDSCFWIDDNNIVLKRLILDFEDYSIEKEEYLLLKIQNLEV